MSTAAKDVTYTTGLGLVLAQSTTTDDQYLYHDGQGSTRSLADASGNIVDSYTYTAFGELYGYTGTPQTDFLYTGQQFDDLTDLYNLRARMYDPGVGRLLSTDSAPLQLGNPVELNRYIYTANNPINLTDPSGLMAGYGSLINEDAETSPALAGVGEATRDSYYISIKSLQHLFKMTAPVWKKAVSVEVGIGLAILLAGGAAFALTAGDLAEQTIIYGDAGAPYPEAETALARKTAEWISEHQSGTGSQTEARPEEEALRQTEQTGTQQKVDDPTQDECDTNLSEAEARAKAREYAAIATMYLDKVNETLSLHLGDYGEFAEYPAPLTFAVSRVIDKNGDCKEVVAVNGKRRGWTLELNKVIYGMASERNANTDGILDYTIAYEPGLQGHAELDLYNAVSDMGPKSLESLRAIGVANNTGYVCKQCQSWAAGLYPPVYVGVMTTTYDGSEDGWIEYH